MLPNAFSTGVGIFVITGVPSGALPNNSIVIAEAAHLRFQCVSGNNKTGNILGVDNSPLPVSIAGAATDGLYINHSINRSDTVEVNSNGTFSEGVYTCRIPGNEVDFNIGVYRNGFNSKDSILYVNVLLCFSL